MSLLLLMMMIQKLIYLGLAIFLVVESIGCWPNPLLEGSVFSKQYLRRTAAAYYREKHQRKGKKKKQYKRVGVKMLFFFICTTRGR
jgi:hypothetical protein